MYSIAAEMQLLGRKSFGWTYTVGLPFPLLLKDDQHPTYVIMLCKCGTSMISTNFFWNVCVKYEKKLKNFFLKLITPKFEYPQTLITMKFENL